MNFIVVHNHFRPGGVRRVIELATPYLVEAVRPPVGKVILAGGEAPSETWWQDFQKLLQPVPAVCETDPALRYVSEQPHTSVETITARLRTFLGRVLAEASPQTCLVWAHNQGLGRNLLLTRELEQACALRAVRLVFHHHDWWFDNRWPRWPEMRRSGFASLSEVAAIILSRQGDVRHVGINQADASVLQRHFPGQAAWLPNPASAHAARLPGAHPQARTWLRQQLGHDAPVWLMPCRLLRRKNIGEALLLTRWLRPEAWLVTTAGVSSPEEEPYANRLSAAARRHGWPLRLGILERNESNGPAIADLLAASEAVLLTSLQEGFGLSYVEAAVARRALIARTLANIVPDLVEWGLRFPQSYREVLVDTTLFHWDRERARQKALYRDWRNALPRELRDWVGQPVLLASGGRPDSVPFSRLTFSAQLEVLAHPVAESWAACIDFNPWLNAWREAAVTGSLQPTFWPRRTAQRLSGTCFARGFVRLLRARRSAAISPSASATAQREFIQDKLQSANLYPLTWNSDT